LATSDATWAQAVGASVAALEALDDSALSWTSSSSGVTVPQKAVLFTGNTYTENFVANSSAIVSVVGVTKVTMDQETYTDNADTTY